MFIGACRPSEVKSWMQFGEYLSTKAEVRGRGKREEGRGKREEGRGKREEGRGKREEGDRREAQMLCR
jgi:hypothetical protein